MKEGWKYESFGNVFPIRMGKTPPRADKEMWDVNKNTKNLWVSVADITSNEGQDIISTKEHISELAAQRMRIVPKGYLLMSFKLTIGKMAFAGKDLFTNEAIIAIPKNDKYNLRFIYYYLSSYNWDTLTTGAEKVKGKTLNKSSIGKIQLPIISLPEQERIVSLLDAEFAKIDAIKANAEKQLQDAKALIQSALKDYLTPKEGWKYVRLGDVATYINGFAFKPDDWSSKGIPIIRIQNLTDSSRDFNYCNREDIPHKFYVNEGDILISWSATLGVFEWSKGKALLNQHIFKVVFNKIDINKQYFKYAIHMSIDEMAKHTNGATMKHIRKGDFDNIRIPIPPLPEQERIVSLLDGLSAKIQSLQSNFDTTVTLCNDLKQSILKDIFG